MFIVAEKDSWRRLSHRIFQVTQARPDFNWIRGRVELLWEGGGEDRGTFRTMSLNGLTFATQNPNGISEWALQVRNGQRRSEEIIWLFKGGESRIWIARFVYCGAERFSMYIIPERR